MIESEVVVVGGGPAGSTCAWKLREAGVETIVLDKADFPRPKPCAGWITPRVLRDLELDPGEYPHNLARYDRLHFHFGGHALTLPTRQFAIRRYEFDQWLLERAGVPHHRITVDQIRQEHGLYMINDTYRCRYLVGAGGTHCPVYRTFFRQLNPRLQESQIVALEDEYIGTINETGCHLWFWEGKLPGYSWYVPKGNGYINVGIGGKSAVLRSRGETIQHHWAQFARTHLGGPPIGRERRTPAGYVYHLRSGVPVVRTGNAFVVGDAAGLGTRDMGEGIGPAVQSGIRAADAIIRRTEYSVRSIRKYSFRELLFPGRKGEGSGAGG